VIKKYNIKKFALAFMAFIIFSGTILISGQPMVLVNNRPLPSRQVISKDGELWVSAQHFLDIVKVDYHINYFNTSLTIMGRNFYPCILRQNTLFIPFKKVVEFLDGKWEKNDNGIIITVEEKNEPLSIGPEKYHKTDFEIPAPSELEVKKIFFARGEKDNFLGTYSLLLTVQVANNSYSDLRGTYLARVSLVDENNFLVSRADIFLHNMRPRERRTVIVDFSSTFGNDARASYQLTTTLYVKKILSGDLAEVIGTYDWRKKVYTVHPVVELGIPGK